MHFGCVVTPYLHIPGLYFFAFPVPSRMINMVQDIQNILEKSEALAS
jgi:hypothetical protein